MGCITRMAESIQTATLITTLESKDGCASLLSVVATMEAMYGLIEDIHPAQQR